MTPSPAEVIGAEDARNPASEAGNTLPRAARIFLMTNSFERGGSERQFVELARALQGAGNSVDLGCLQPKGPYRNEVGAVEHFTLGGSLFGWKSVRSRYKLANRLRSNRTAIAHAFDYYTNLTLIPAAKLARTPVVITSLRQLGDLLTPLQRRAQRLMFRWSDCVICNSHVAARTLLEAGFPERRVAVIGNGLRSEAFAEATPALARRPDTVRIGMIARMNAESKNHKFLLNVAARLHDRITNFEIVLVGDGPLRAELEKRADELRIGDVVRFLGDRTDIPAILAALDVTVLPSASESLSNAILESMAAGVPVIANEIGGNVELVTDERGVLVPMGDEEALAAALQRMCGDAELRQSLGRRAKKFAQENFTIEQMRKQHEDIYARLLEQKGWRA